MHKCNLKKTCTIIDLIVKLKLDPPLRAWLHCATLSYQQAVQCKNFSDGAMYICLLAFGDEPALSPNFLCLSLQS